MKVRLGTRGSALAMAQTRDAQRRLEAAGCTTEITIVETAGDREQDRAFAAVGTAGIFVRELESALLDGRVDLAVHSYKDLPSVGPEELVVAAMPERLDPADVLLIQPAFHDPRAPALPVKEGARIGTASARRRALVEHLRPDLEPTFLRGNVPTRIRKLREGSLHAIVLAAAGLIRLQRTDDAAQPSLLDGLILERLDPAQFVPAPCQGALAYQVRREDRALIECLRSLDLAAWRRPLAAERTALALVEGGCQLPFGAWCDAGEDTTLELVACLGREDGVRWVRRRGDEPTPLAREVITALLADAEPGP